MKIRTARKILRFVKRGVYSKTQVARAEKSADCHVVYLDGNPFFIEDHRPKFFNVGFSAWSEMGKS